MNTKEKNLEMKRYVMNLLEMCLKNVRIHIVPCKNFTLY